MVSFLENMDNNNQLSLMPFPESKCNNVTSSKTPVKFCKTKMEDRGQVKVTANMYSKDAVIFCKFKMVGFYRLPTGKLHMQT